MSRITIDERGMCSEFVRVKIDKETLNNAKEPTFEQNAVGHIDLDELFFGPKK